MGWVFLFVACCLPVLFGESEETGEKRYAYEEKHMGVSVKFLVYAGDEAHANKVARKAFARIADLNAKLSDYDPESELRRLCEKAGSPAAIPVSEDLFTVLNHAYKVSLATDGAFDVTVGPVVRLWRRARRQKQLPDPDRLKQELGLVGFQKIQLSKKTKSVQLTKHDMRLDLGGIAKGYVGDEALKVFQSHGISRVMIDAGGDLVLGDAPPGEAGWRVAIAPIKTDGDQPAKILELKNVAVATSGDAFQFVEIDGVRYSHIVNPKTGLGLTDRSGVTVIAPTGIEADSLASAVSVLGPKDGLKLIRSLPKTETRIVRDGPLQEFVSKGFWNHRLKTKLQPTRSGT